MMRSVYRWHCSQTTKSWQKKIVLSAADRLDKQMDNDGRFPKEMERTISLHYTTFTMNAFVIIAQMAEKVGIDFWNMTTPSGKSLKKGFEALRPYISKEKEWEGQQIKEFEYEDGYPLLMEASFISNVKIAKKQLDRLLVIRRNDYV